jgi:hypothetical protein
MSAAPKSMFIGDGESTEAASAGGAAPAAATRNPHPVSAATVHPYRWDRVAWPINT